jgi:hypothetical protein
MTKNVGKRWAEKKGHSRRYNSKQQQEVGKKMVTKKREI